jgi:hypothetical protein
VRVDVRTAYRRSLIDGDTHHNAPDRTILPLPEPQSLPITEIDARKAADVGMDDLTPVTHDYEAYDNKFTGTIRKIVIGVGPLNEGFDPPLEWNGVG